MLSIRNSGLEVSREDTYLENQQEFLLGKLVAWESLKSRMIGRRWIYLRMVVCDFDCDCRRMK